MKLFINDFIEINKNKNIHLIYSPNHHKFLYVSSSLLNILENLTKKYSNKEINMNNKYITQIKSTSAFEKLYNSGIIYKDKNKYLKKQISLKEIYPHLTHNCNLNCTYCYDKNNFSNKYLDKTVMSSIIEFIKSNKVERVVLTGGEPLLHPNVEKIINILKDNKITVHLLTNGTLIHKYVSVIDKVDLIIISLDSDKSINRVGLNGIKLINTINALPTKIKNKILLRSVISKGEENNIKTNKILSENLGVSFTWIPRIPNNIGEIKYYPSTNNIENIDTFEGTQVLSNCGACSNVIAIDPNGDIYPCQNLIDPNMKICNILDKNINNVYKESKVVNSFLDLNVNFINKCNNCNIKYFCGSGCRAISYRVYGSIYDNIDFMCTFLKILTKAKVKEYK